MQIFASHGLKGTQLSQLTCEFRTGCSWTMRGCFSLAIEYDLLEVLIVSRISFSGIHIRPLVSDSAIAEEWLVVR